MPRQGRQREHAGRQVDEGEGPPLGRGAEEDGRGAGQIRNGKGPMPGFKARFKESEISELVAYIRALAKK
jgi:mono/diheme cytochrome c family protein